jgi:hypothetical protein
MSFTKHTLILHGTIVVYFADMPTDVVWNARGNCMLTCLPIIFYIPAGLCRGGGGVQGFTFEIILQKKIHIHVLNKLVIEESVIFSCNFSTILYFHTLPFCVEIKEVISRLLCLILI